MNAAGAFCMNDDSSPTIQAAPEAGHPKRRGTMRTYTCDNCGDTLHEGITIKHERTGTKTRYQHLCGGEPCYQANLPTKGEKLTIQWSDFREGDETNVRTDTTLAQVQIRNPGLVTREVHKKK